MTGRPSTFSLELAATICERVADGHGLKAICAGKGMPARSAVYRWLDADDVFKAMYGTARQERADMFADEIITIADTEPDPHKARVMIDARKWSAARLNPKVYGDRIQVDSAVTVKLTDDQLDERIRPASG